MVYDEHRVSRVLGSVKAISSKYACVKEVQDHYAGYFDELGLTIQLESGTASDEWHSAATELLLYLNKDLPKGNDAFSWMLFFYQDLTQVGLFFPGDSLADNCADVVVNPKCK